jgi:hypothetical protein
MRQIPGDRHAVGGEISGPILDGASKEYQFSMIFLVV